MSIQLQICAADLDQLKKQLSALDKSLKLDALGAFQELAEEIELDEDELEAGKKRINELFAGKKADPTETLAEVTVINYLMASSDTTTPDLDDAEMEWPYTLIADMYEQFQKRFSDVTDQLLKYFVEGRPLLGQQFGEDTGGYMYLTNAEVKQLHAGLATVLKTASEIVDSGAMNEQDFEGSMIDTLEGFMQTLEAVHAEQKDLFAVVC